MRYLAIAAAALAATTSFASADSMPVATGPVQLSAAQLDEVTAGRRSRSRLIINRSNIQAASIRQNANAVAINDVGGVCVGACFALAVGGNNVAVLRQNIND